MYVNVLLNKFNIYKDNVDKCGVYHWVNKINNKAYIGSSVNLRNRFINYFSDNYMSKKLVTHNSYIYNALLLYGHDKFNLEILEYCDKKSVINKEQYYMDLLKPEYNILKIAGSTLGHKHSPKTLLKLRNRKFTAEVLANIRKARVRITTERLLNNNPVSRVGHCVTISNSSNNSIMKYKSIRSVARNLSVSYATFTNCIKNNRLLKDLYIITKDN